jgi:hypothetical protein
MKMEFFITFPVLVDMTSNSDEQEFISQGMKSCPIQIGNQNLQEQKTWYANLWRSQERLRDALLASPDDLIRFLGLLALQDLAAGISELPVKSLKDLLLPTIERLDLQDAFFPAGMNAEFALTETALNLVESVQLTFGAPTFSAESMGTVQLS